ncbi:MAG: sulfatase-modifying factor protein, partial [Bacteroidetes bacterium]|nr:sulfatase-modifying factor protein [Bacteroidota bacterium]
MKKSLITFFLTFSLLKSFSQDLKKLGISTTEGLEIETFHFQETLIKPAHPYPLFSLRINDQLYTTQSGKVLPTKGDTTLLQLAGLEAQIWQTKDYSPGSRYEIRLKNNTPGDTITIENLVPFGESSAHVYITGKGKHALSRAHLFRPGKTPVNVIVPDNAWELGYSGIELSENLNICALARRKSWDPHLARRRRFETILYPQGTVTYHLWFDSYQGVWQEGLRRMFQERYLYDLEGQTFNESLYQRKDLAWIRHTYSMHLIMAWDSDFYDSQKKAYQLDSFLERGRRWYGGNDVIGIWPNWPTLGLDQRNQWDLWRDLPGGTDQLRQLAEMCREKGTRFFISYNPWDESTRWEDHHAGMSDMIAAITADGVVLDTEGKSSREHQEAADKVRPGVIMYSEGMAVPKDMPGIVAGRVHNALYYPPFLNLNKFIRPDFAIFRVAEIYKEPIRREYITSFFNGYGTEINQFRPGRPDWIEKDYRFWGQLLRIQRENAANFTVKDYKPLIPTTEDLIYVNQWPGKDKTVFTLFSLQSEGFAGPLFKTDIREGYHLLDLWNHELIESDTTNGQWVVPVDLEGFSSKWLGTNNEGAAGAIAILPNLLKVERQGEQLHLSASRGD